MDGVELEMPEENEQEEVLSSGGIVILPNDLEDDGEDIDESTITSEEAVRLALEKRKKQEDSWTTPTISQFQVKQSFTYRLSGDSTQVILREFNNINCQGAVIFEGFPSKGMTSVIAADFLIEQLQLPLIGDMLCSTFPSACRVRDSQSANTCRFYGDSRMVVFISEHNIESDLCYFVSQAIFEFAARHGCTHIFTAENYPDKLRLPKQEDMTEEQVIDMLTKAFRRQNSRNLDEKSRGGRRGGGRGGGGGSGGGGDEGEDEDDEDEVGDREEAQEASTNRAAAAMREARDKLIAQNKTEEDDILFITNDHEFGRQLRGFGYVYIRNAILGGISGRLQAEAVVRSGVIVTCLVARYNPLLTEAKTPVAICHALDRILGQRLSIDTKKLVRRVKKVEQSIGKAISEMASKSHKAPPSMYL